MSTLARLPRRRRLAFRLALYATVAALALGVVASLADLADELGIQRRLADQDGLSLLTAIRPAARLAAERGDGEMAHALARTDLPPK